MWRVLYSLGLGSKIVYDALPWKRNCCWSNMRYVLCLRLQQNVLYGAVSSRFYCTVSVCISNYPSHAVYLDDCQQKLLTFTEHPELTCPRCPSLLTKYTLLAVAVVSGSQDTFWSSSLSDGCMTFVSADRACIILRLLRLPAAFLSRSDQSNTTGNPNVLCKASSKYWQ